MATKAELRAADIKKNKAIALKKIKDYWPDIEQSGIDAIMANIQAETSFLSKNTMERGPSWKNNRSNKTLSSINGNMDDWAKANNYNEVEAEVAYNKLTDVQKNGVRYQGDENKEGGGYGALQITVNNYGLESRSDTLDKISKTLIDPKTGKPYTDFNTGVKPGLGAGDFGLGLDLSFSYYKNEHHKPWTTGDGGSFDLNNISGHELRYNKGGINRYELTAQKDADGNKIKNPKPPKHVGSAFASYNTGSESTSESTSESSGEVSFDEDRYVDIARRKDEGQDLTQEDLDWKESIDDKWFTETTKKESEEKDSDFVAAVTKATKRSRITEEEEQKQQDDADFKKSISDPRLDGLIDKKIKNGKSLTDEEKERKEWTDAYGAKKRGEEFDELVLRGDKSGGLGGAIIKAEETQTRTTEETGIAPLGDIETSLTDEEEEEEGGAVVADKGFDVREAKKLGLMYDKDGNTYDPDQLESMMIKPEGLMDYEQYSVWDQQQIADPNASFEDFQDLSEEDYSVLLKESPVSEGDDFTFEEWKERYPDGTQEEYDARGTTTEDSNGKYFDLRGDASGMGKESFLDKMGGLSSLIGLATGAMALGTALKDVDIPKDPKLGPAFQQRLSESKRLAQQGLTPSELAKAHNDLDSSYATGIENIVRGSAGNRAQFMAGLGGLDVARQSALMDIAVADAGMQRQNQEKYDKMMMVNEQYEAARESKYDQAKYQQEMATKSAASALAGSALSMVNQNIGDRQLNRYHKMKTEKLMREMGFRNDSKGKSTEKKMGVDPVTGEKTQTSFTLPDVEGTTTPNMLDADEVQDAGLIDALVVDKNKQQALSSSPIVQPTYQNPTQGMIQPAQNPNILAAGLAGTTTSGLIDNNNNNQVNLGGSLNNYNLF